MQNQKLKITLIALVVIFLAAIFFYLQTRREPTSRQSEKLPEKITDNKMTGKEALAVAEVEAMKWQADALISKFESLATSTSGQGRSDDWNFLFISKTKTGTGLQVMIRNRKLGGTAEVPYVGDGGELPENTMSSEEAIGKLRQIAGYENEKVSGVEMIYGPDGKQWYWAVKTSRGTVSINAKK